MKPKRPNGLRNCANTIYINVARFSSRRQHIDYSERKSLGFRFVMTFMFETDSSEWNRRLYVNDVKYAIYRHVKYKYPISGVRAKTKGL